MDVTPGSDDDIDPARDEQHRCGRMILTAQARALDALIHDLLRLDPEGDRADIRVPILMLQAAGTSLHSVLALTAKRDMAIRDCFAITRAAVETAINAAYIAIGGAETAGRAVRHMRQKRWRDLHRTGTAGGMRIEVARDVGIEADAIPGLRAALDEFTDAQGRERPFWTKASVDRRIDAVTRAQPRAGMCLGVAAFAIYRPASELIHGSYYGVNLFWQGSRATPARTRREIDELWMNEHFVTLLTALFFATSGAIEAIARLHGLPEHVERQDALSKALSDLIESMSGADPAPDHRFAATPRTSDGE